MGEEYTEEEMEILGMESEVSEEESEDMGVSEGESTEVEESEESEDNGAVGETPQAEDVVEEVAETQPKAEEVNQTKIEPEETKPITPVPSIAKCASLVVAGGKYAGMTLGEVADIKTLDAIELYDNYKASIDSENKAIEAEEAAKTAATEALSQELVSFSNDVAKELFGADTYEALPDDKQAEAYKLIEATTTWMTETGRGGGSVKDAYALMTMDDKIKQSKKGVIDKFVKSVSKIKLSSTSSSNVSSSGNGLGKYEGMDSDDFAEAIENMSEPEFDKLMKNAPESLRDAHPGAPWE